MYCSKCGKEVDKGAKYCTYCGQHIGSFDPLSNSYTDGRTLPCTPWGKPVIGEKSGLIAVLLSLLIPGLGTVYAGRGFRGLGIFLGQIVAYGVALVFLAASFTNDSNPAVLFSPLIAAVIIIGYHVFAMYDGYKACKINNQLWAQYLGYH